MWQLFTLLFVCLLLLVLLMLGSSLSYLVCPSVDVGNIENGDLIVYLHANYIGNPLKRCINSILVHRHFSHVGVAWRDPATKELFVLEQTSSCCHQPSPPVVHKPEDCSMSRLATKAYNGRVYCMKRRYPTLIPLTRDDVCAQLMRFHFWHPPYTTLRYLGAALYAMCFPKPSQRQEVWCTEWVGHIQSMYDNVGNDQDFILSMRHLLKKYGSTKVYSILLPQKTCDKH